MTFERHVSGTTLAVRYTMTLLLATQCQTTKVRTSNIIPTGACKAMAFHDTGKGCNDQTRCSTWPNEKERCCHSKDHGYCGSWRSTNETEWIDINSQCSLVSLTKTLNTTKFCIMDISVKQKLRHFPLQLLSKAGGENSFKFFYRAHMSWHKRAMPACTNFSRQFR